MNGLLASAWRMVPDREFFLDVGRRLGEGATNPETYTGAAKEATYGLMGLPGDLGYVAGNFPAVRDAWQEGKPLFENVGSYEDTPMTTDWIARKMGTPFSGSADETAGRVLGGLVSLPGMARQFAKGARFAGMGGQGAGNMVGPGARGATQRGGKYYEDMPAPHAVPYGVTDTVINPTRGELDDILELSKVGPDQISDAEAMSGASREGQKYARLIRDPEGNVYVSPGMDILHQQKAENAGLPEGFYDRGEIIENADGTLSARWFDETDWDAPARTDFDPYEIVETTRPLREAAPGGETTNYTMEGLLKGKQRGSMSFRDDPRLAKAKETHTGLLQDARVGQEVSTRVPTSKKLDPDAPHRTNEMLLNEDVIKSDPNYMKAAAAELRQRSMTPEWVKELNDEGVIDYQIDLETKNLTQLYNDMDPALAETSTFWYPGANIHNQSIADKFGVPFENVTAVQAVLSPKTRWDINVEMGDRLIDIMTTKRGQSWTPEMTNRMNEFDYSPNVKQHLDKVVGRSLQDLDDDPIAQALWIRLFDETHNEAKFRELAPDGRKLGYARSKNGEPLKFGWQTLPNISKAIQAYNAQDMEQISRLLGDAHKVRSFFNNMSNPLSELGQITSDTHHVNAALMQPMGLKDPKVLKNFSGVSSNMTGLQGIYPIHAASAQRAADILQKKPREVQSATWEHIRSVWPDAIKNNLAEPVKGYWDLYGQGLLSRQDAFDLSLEAAAKERARKGLLGVPIWTDK